MRLLFCLFFVFLSSFCYGNDGKSTATLEATFSLKSASGGVIPFQNGMPVPSFEKQKRATLNLAGEWRKQRFTADHDLSLSARDAAGLASLIAEAQNRFAVDYDDSGWEVKILPWVENALNAYEKTPEYYEDGIWYRRTINVPDSLQGSFVKLMFYSVNYVADVWLNDQYLGYHEGGYTPFAFDVSEHIRYGGANLIAVRVDNPPWGERKDIVPYYKVDWFNYAGIIHDVYLEFSAPISIVRAQVVPKTTTGLVETQVVVLNAGTAPANVQLELAVFQADVHAGNIRSELASDLIGIAADISGATSVSMNLDPDSVGLWQSQLTINNPRLWFPASPHLYVLRATLRLDGREIDSFSSQFGIRTVATAGNKVLLNNAPVFFPGIARHEDSPVYGRSIPTDKIFADLEVVNKMNVHLLRTAHYPNHPATYLYTDRLGLTAMEEIPVWWFDLEEAWKIQNEQRHIHQQMWREMIFRDYNRPSIILWSTCNECFDVPNRKIFIETVHADLDNNYPDGRLVTQSAAADRPGAHDPSQASCDVAGWTMYFGIFHGQSELFYQGTKAFLDSVRKYYPEKPALDTEFGVWSGEDRRYLNRQAIVCSETFRAFKERALLTDKGELNPNGFLMATTWWCVFDWYSHGHPTGFQSMGVYQMDRTQEKLVAAVLRSSYKPFYQTGGTLTSVQPVNLFTIPNQLTLAQNFPNPFNPNTVIAYHLPMAGPVQLDIYDIRGRWIDRLVHGHQGAGDYTVSFDGSRLASGVYFYRLQMAEQVQTRKMLLIH